MELIRISDTKLKLMLSAEDLARYELSCDTIDQADPHSRRCFRRILEDARRQTGFDPGGERILVQLYPERNGGCEMFVTKIGPPAKRVDLPPAAREYVYRFTSLGDLLYAARRMRDESTVLVSRAYVIEGERRQLYICTDTAVPYMGEYNGQEEDFRLLPYLREYGRCFCRDTSILAEFA